MQPVPKSNREREKLDLSVYIISQQVRADRALERHVVEWISKKIRARSGRSIPDSLAGFNKTNILPLYLSVRSVHHGVSPYTLLESPIDSQLWDAWKDLKNSYPGRKVGLIFNTNVSGYWMMHNNIDKAFLRGSIIHLWRPHLPEGFAVWKFTDFLKVLEVGNPANLND